MLGAMARGASTKPSRHAKKGADADTDGALAQRPFEAIDAGAGKTAGKGADVAPLAPGAATPQDRPKVLRKKKRPKSLASTVQGSGDTAQGSGGAAPTPVQPPDPAAQVSGTEDRRGVVHLPSLPWLMRIEKLRHLLEKHGEVGRIYLVPESAADRKQRRGNRSNKTRYTEGWVEFADRKVARRVAEALNGTTIGGKKRRNYHRDEMWCMKYLPRFKWHDLVEAKAYRTRVRKVRFEQKASQARRENNWFLENVEKAKKRRFVEARLAAKPAGGDGDAGARQERIAPGRPPTGPSRTFSSSASIVPGADISDRILSSLF